MFFISASLWTLRLINICLALSLWWVTSAFGQTSDNAHQSSLLKTNSNPTPIEQTLVPESVYAQQLVSVLNLAQDTDEEKSERLLSSLGIEPKNGWISEYPVTPAVLGEVDKGIANASEQGLIKMPKSQALKMTGELKSKLGLDVSPGSDSNNVPPVSKTQLPSVVKIYSYTDAKGTKNFTDNFDSIPPEYQAQAKVVSQYTPSQVTGPAGGQTSGFIPPNAVIGDPSAINGYYQTQGPPVVTYYAPPAAYSYLYSWVPYPFWSTGYYFPGYFVLNDFQRRVHFNNNPYFVSHHAGPVRAGSQNFNGGSQNNWYGDADSRAGARNIVGLHQNHPVNTNTANIPQSPQFNQRFSSGINNQDGRLNQPRQEKIQNQQTGINRAPIFQPNQEVHGFVFQEPHQAEIGGMRHEGGFGGHPGGGGRGEGRR